MADFRYLTGARFLVWGEEGTERRFLQWQHPTLGEPVTLLLSPQDIAQLLHALQAELPPGAHTKGHSVQ